MLFLQQESCPFTVQNVPRRNFSSEKFGKSRKMHQMSQNWPPKRRQFLRKTSHCVQNLPTITCEGSLSNFISEKGKFHPVELEKVHIMFFLQDTPPKILRARRRSLIRAQKKKDFQEPENKHEQLTSTKAPCQENWSDF